MAMLASLLVLAHVRAGDELDYEGDIKPLLRTHCLVCHNADESNADLDLSTFDALMKGGGSGPVVKPGLPDSSQLYRAMAHLEGAPAMPPESPPVGEESLAMVREWIRGGLVAGEGKKSLLRTVGEMGVQPGGAVALSPVVPKDWPVMPARKSTHPPTPQAMAVSPCAPVVAVAGDEQILVYVVDEAARQKGHGASSQTEPRRDLTLVGCLPFPEGVIFDLRFSQNGAVLLAAGGRGAHSGSVVLYDVQSGKRLGAIGDESDAVLAADISADQRSVALGGPGKVVKIYDTRTGKLVHRIAKHTDWITALAFSPDGSLLASGDRSGGIHVWEVESAAITFTLDEHKVRVSALTWRPDGQILASAAEDGNVIVWNATDGWPVHNLSAHVVKNTQRSTGTLSLAFSAQGHLVSSGRDRMIRVWKPEGVPLATFTVPSLPLQARFLADGKRVVYAEWDGSVQVLPVRQ
jgi:hypothetical protein